MRSTTPSSFALGRQLAEWRRPLDDDPAVDEAVVRMLHTLDHYLQHEPAPEDGRRVSRAAAG
jgi:hypothetical protein